MNYSNFSADSFRSKLNLKKCLISSLAVHAVMITIVLFFIPAPEKKKSGGELFTDLVSPEELISRKPPILRPMQPAQDKSMPSFKPRPAAPSPTIVAKRTPRSEKGTLYEKMSRLSPAAKDTKAAPPSPVISNGGQDGFHGESGSGSHVGSIPKPGKIGPTLREKLFDRKVIGDLAMRNVEKEQKNTPLSFDTSEYRFLIYNRRLKERIESIWHYPPDAAAQGIHGDLIIRFTIKKNGQLGSAEVVRTSGHTNLDIAAIEALKEGTPYWPLPDEWGMEAYTIEGHFVYSLYGYYIR